MELLLIPDTSSQSKMWRPKSPFIKGTLTKPSHDEFRTEEVLYHEWGDED